MTVDDIVWRSARGLAAAVARRDLSAVELLDAHLEQIARVNPAVNAIVTLEPERARAAAERIDRLAALGEPLPPLAGLPVAVKDLEDTAGMRTTYGSPIHRDHVPEADSLLVERLRAAGAVIVGKTNTPEFGAGAHTFNPVFGATRNPYDLARTPGGSSGGAAAAVACGMLPLADGSDLAASLRNPAAFCNVVGLRPSPGAWPQRGVDPWDPLSVLGPIARSVDDAAFMFGALAGDDPRSPLSAPRAGDPGPVEPAELGGLRIAWSDDLGGLPVEPEVAAVLTSVGAKLEAAGARVEAAEPALDGADEAFEVLRAVGFAQAYAGLLETHADQLKETIRWNTRIGLELDGGRIARALELRGEAFHRMREFLAGHDVLALPTTQVAPFPVEVDWVRTIAGREMRDYLEWMRSCSRITVTAHPAVSIPAGFTDGGLPVGLQLVGRHRGEAALLAVAAAIEAVTGAGRVRPAVATGAA